MVLDSGSGKTPVSLLQEICTRKSITPKYELLQVEGAVHEPTFQYRLSLEYNGVELEKTGTGRSKKEAKHNTALSMLVGMGLLAEGAVLDKGHGPGHSHQGQIEGVLEDGGGDVSGNPVGVLQELCMKLKHPPPTYEVHSEEGLPHERVFAMACRVGEHFVEIGRGKSKKLAKRQAAALMADRLRNIPQEPAVGYEFEEDDDRIFERLTIADKDKEQNITTLSKLQYIVKTKFAELKDWLPSVIQDPVKFLSDIEDHTFKVIYVDFDEVSTSQQQQCLVQITTDPPIVGFGQGMTPTEAKVNAAKDAIYIFKQFLDLPASS